MTAKFLHRGSTGSLPSDRFSEPQVRFVTLIVIVLAASLVMPVSFWVGSVRLPVYRLVLILVSGISFWYLFRGCLSLGRTFLFLLLYSLVATVSLLVIEPGIGLETRFIVIFEILAPYAVGRLIFSRQVWTQLFFRTLMLLSFFLAIFGLIESLSSFNLPILFFSRFFDVPTVLDIASRFDLTRAQSVFDHPILFGVFGLSLFPLILIRSNPFPVLNRWFVFFVSSAIVFSSLSSGPILVYFAMLFLIIYDRVFVRYGFRWWIFGVAGLLIYVSLDLLSNRTPFHLVASYLAFSQQTAYGRILIFQHGWDTIFSFPFFGVGFGDWLRQSWMTESIDMFWLVGGVRYGFFAFCFQILAYFSGVFAVLGSVRSRRRSDLFGSAVLFALVSFFLVGWTVHFWNQVYILFGILLGYGHGPNDVEEEAVAAHETTHNSRYLLRYTRFD